MAPLSRALQAGTRPDHPRPGGYFEAMTEQDRITAIQAVVDRVTSWQDGATEGTVETELRRAIEREEFELFYQPELGVDNFQTHLVEALIRWRKPDGSTPSPLDRVRTNDPLVAYPSVLPTLTPTRPTCTAHAASASGTCTPVAAAKAASAGTGTGSPAGRARITALAGGGGTESFSSADTREVSMVGRSTTGVPDNSIGRSGSPG